VPVQHFENIHGNIFWIFNGAIYLQRHICEKFIQKSNHPLCRYFSIRRKSNQLQSLVIEWCQKRKSISLWHLWRQRNRRNTFLWVKLSIDGKELQRQELPKKKAEEKHLNAPILHYKKNGQEIILYSSTSFSFINLTKSLHFLLASLEIKSIFTSLFLMNMAIIKLDLGELTK
jgi:hypothetical protein